MEDALDFLNNNNNKNNVFRNRSCLAQDQTVAPVHAGKLLDQPPRHSATQMSGWAKKKMRNWLKVNFVSFINTSINLHDAKEEIDLFKLTINYLRRHCTGETGLRTENLIL